MQGWHLAGCCWQCADYSSSSSAGDHVSLNLTEEAAAVTKAPVGTALRLVALAQAKAHRLIRKKQLFLILIYFVEKYLAK